MLHDISVDYDPGLHLLLGPNGAGKTTLFRALAGILPPKRGQVLIDGHDPQIDVSAKALVGVAGHRPALAPRLSVADNLRYWSRVLALPAQCRERRISDVLDLLDLVSIADQEARTLSRGQAQRVGLAKALLGDPLVLLLDEATAGLDPAIAGRLRQSLRSLADSGRTVLTSSHQLGEAGALSDDVTVLHNGRIADRGEPGALRARLLGSKRCVRVRARGDLIANLTRLGYRANSSRHGVVVEVTDDAAVETLVADLVRAGVGVREVAPAENPLEEVYLHLQDHDLGRGHDQDRETSHAR